MSTGVGVRVVSLLVFRVVPIAERHWRSRLRNFNVRFRLALLGYLSLVLAGAVGLSGELLVDVAKKVGIDFVHDNGMAGEFLFPEMTGQGAALLDFDFDGDLDVYLVQGGALGSRRMEGDLNAAGDRLFRNEISAGAALSFVDATDRSGIRATGYGMGVATGDADGDGWVDLYLSNLGHNQLWRNRGDGSFELITDRAGVDDPRWSTGAAFFDLDRDGDLDLYVVNYVEFDLERNPPCYAPSSRRDYCGPSAFRPVPDRLFRNRGDGTFEDVTVQSLGSAAGHGLGVVTLDVGDDGWTDLAVANDGSPNFLWRNRGSGVLSEEALLSGVALNTDGQAEAGMGVDAGDFDRDGDEDIFFAHLKGESNTLYVDIGDGLFEDRTRALGLAAPSLSFTSFGALWLDVDHDGWLDLAVAGGAVRILEELAEQGDPYPLSQENRVYLNRQGRRFEEATESVAPEMLALEVTRGLVRGDVDQDGDEDLLLTNNHGPTRLLENRAPSTDGWLGVELRRPSGAPAVGSRVLLRDGARRSVKRTRTEGSYASAHDPRLLFAGISAEGARLELRDPSGREWDWTGLKGGLYYVALGDRALGAKEGAPER